MNVGRWTIVRNYDGKPKAVAREDYVPDFLADASPEEREQYDPEPRLGDKGTAVVSCDGCPVMTEEMAQRIADLLNASEGK